MTLSRRTVLQVSTAALMGLGAAGASAQTAPAAAPPASRHRALIHARKRR